MPRMSIIVNSWVHDRRAPNADATKRPLSKSCGFTVLEMLIALFIGSLLLFAVVPNGRALIAATEMRDRVDALSAALNVARSEAIKRATRVDLCPTLDRVSCAASSTWDRGWLMFVNDGAGTQPSSPATIVAQQAAAPPGITMTGNRPVADYVSFTSVGHARRHDGALQMGTFTICRRGDIARKLVLANSGRVRVDVTQEVCP